jgi:hypothetical protein
MKGDFMKKFIGLIILLFVNSNSFASENWSGEIEKLTVYESGSAMLIVSNPRNGPSSTFGCTQNVVYLGVKDAVANNAFLSQALTIYAANKPMRFGIRGTGSTCEAFYITAE